MEQIMYRKLLGILIVLIMCIGSFAQRVPMPYAKIQFFDRNGNPLVYGKLYTYVAGTTTPKGTYVSSSGAANTNPVILDAAGRADVWLDADTSYKFILKDSNDVQQWSVDSVSDWGGLLYSGSSDLAGDVEGNYDNLTVTALQGTPVATTSPTQDQVLSYDSGEWTPSAITDLSTILYSTPSTLSVSAVDGTIATDASASSHFRVTLTTDCPCTLSTPTDPTDGQIVTWEVIQASGGNETLAYSAAFKYGTDVGSPTITVTADKRDFITAVYNSGTTSWYVLRVVQGY